ncbi:MAG: Spy/CpxP family protein refolding chaperone [Planctomycetes bacterium]|nr:Spy/CpxP family protein refolding chaperone [Planctomycetota bacterium]
MADRDAGPGRGGARGHGPRLPILHALSRLDVTEEQHVQIRTILDDNAEGMEAAREALNEAMATLRDATMNEADDATLQAAATQVGIAAGLQATTHVALMKSIKSVLTEEQLNTLAELKEQRDTGQVRRGAGHGMGPGPRGAQRGNFDRPAHRGPRRGQ